MCLFKVKISTLFLFIVHVACGQDPNFSQFFSSPLNINPALTAHTKGQWRLISNYRDQWRGPSTPYTTVTTSFDTKLLQNAPQNFIDENYRLGVGGMFMNDKALDGVLKSNYASFNISGNILLAEGSGTDWDGNRINHNRKYGDGDGVENRIGVGLGIIYGTKRLDLSQLSFSEQFNGNGFDPSLPTGEAALTLMKPYISTSAGLLYSYISSSTNFDLGIAGFHFNKPKQSFVDDEHQYLQARYVLHGNIETILSDRLMLQSNAIYQKQSSASYFSVGGAFGYFPGDLNGDAIINAGLWYWSNHALIPYIGLGYKNFQLGATYEVITSRLNEADKRSRTFEFSLIIRGNGKPNGIIPSPWK